MSAAAQDPARPAFEADELLDGLVDDSKLSPRWRIALWRLFVVVAVIVVWDLVVRSGLVSSTFLPAPWDVAKSVTTQQDLLHNVFVTLTEALVGFALGTIVGVVLGLTLGLMRRVSEVLAPYITMTNSMPRVALAPLFILWFGIGMWSHIILVFSLVVMIVLTNAIAGAQAVEQDHLILARLLGASRTEAMRKIILPSCMPWIFASMRLAWAYALTGAVVGEMFLGQAGLGYLINAGSGVFDVAGIFAALLITVVLAWLVDGVLRFAERTILRWRPTVEI